MPIQELQNYNGNGTCRAMKFHDDKYKSSMIKWAKLGGWTVSSNLMGGMWKISRKQHGNGTLEKLKKYPSLSKSFKVINKTM